MEDKKFKEFMLESKLEIQFPDFEDKVMEQIELKEKSRKSVWRNLKISWIFFILGSFIGIIGSQYLTNLGFPFFEKYNNWYILAIEILIVIIITFQFDRLIYFTFRKRN